MKPPAFAYYRPQSLKETLTLLNDIPGAKILAGGQSLIPMMNMRLAHPDALIDVNRLGGLSRITDTGEHLVIGALVRHDELESDPSIQQYCPIMAQAEHLIGHPAIRSRGTIGGSLSHADPAAELPVIATLLDAAFTVQSVDETHSIDACEFFLGYFTTALAPNEMLTEIRIPRISQEGLHIEEYAIRFGDFALVIAAAAVALNADGTIRESRIALGGIADIPWRDRSIEAALKGQYPDTLVFAEAGARIAEAIDPPEDLHASAGYRRQLAQGLVHTALQKATIKARRSL